MARAIPAMRAKSVLGSKTGGQQSPIPELKEPWTPPEWDRPDEVRRGRGEEEEKRGVNMSSMSRLAATGWGSRTRDQDRIRQSQTW